MALNTFTRYASFTKTSSPETFYSMPNKPSKSQTLASRNSWTCFKTTWCALSPTELLNFRWTHFYSRDRQISCKFIFPHETLFYKIIFYTKSIFIQNPFSRKIHFYTKSIFTENPFLHEILFLHEIRFTRDLSVSYEFLAARDRCSWFGIWRPCGWRLGCWGHPFQLLYGRLPLHRFRFLAN